MNFRVLALLVVTVIGATPVIAQTPAELIVRVHSADGAPIASAITELAGSSAAATTDATGRARLRVQQSGTYDLRVSRIGYATISKSVILVTGVTTVSDAVLQTLPVIVADVTGRSDSGSEGFLDREKIDRMGGITVAAALATMPGIVVRRDAQGGPELLSIRGSAARDVLVMVDGQPLNDPVSGEADLSRIPLSSVESIVLEKGAQSAKYGNHALAGVILIRTRRTSAIVADIGAGSLGARAMDLHAGHASLSGGGAWQALSGRFRFQQPASLGGAWVQRENTDAKSLHAYGTLTRTTPIAVVKLNSSYQSGSRGLPGRGFAPSPYARQRDRSIRAGLAMDNVAHNHIVTGIFDWQLQNTRFYDFAPPFGLPYDDSVQTVAAQMRSDFTVQYSSAVLSTGAAASSQRTRSTSLDKTITNRTAGVFARIEAIRQARETSIRGNVQLRVDYDGLQRRGFISHALSLSATTKSADLEAGYRSAFNSPTLGDQFFRAGYAIQPNPLLHAEQVHELSARAGAHAGETLEVSVEVYRGKVEGMIVWAPDYRFVWSPQNENVAKGGAEVTTRVALGKWRTAGWLAFNRVTYDRIPGGVQVAYRPRTSASVSLERTGAIDLRVESKYIGERTTAPTALNTLAGFWTTSAALSIRPASLGSAGRAGIRIDRMLNEKGSMVFGYPDPGRIVTLELRVGTSANVSRGTNK